MSAPMHMRVTKRTWYDKGGFKNPALFRKGDRRGGWTYWIDVSRWYT
jgi:hypothetical protein